MGEPVLQREVRDRLVPRIEADARVVRVEASGSLAPEGRGGDEFSDVDLVVVVRDADYAEVMASRLELIASWAPLVVGFTGEHVGEPRVIISLVGPPLVHVDVKFVSESDADAARFTAPGPGYDPQWVEDRFWVWMHYAATKAGRGEWYEALDLLAFVRGTVLGPLAALAAGAEPRGVRHLEAVAPAAASELRATVCGYDPAAIVGSLRASVDLYARWRVAAPPAIARTEAEGLTRDYLDATLP